MILRSAAELSRLRTLYKDKTIVLCHGCFDVFHYGHLTYLKKSKCFGDILVVSITGDRFVNKGADRPVFDIDKRLQIIDELRCVDYCCVSNSYDSTNIIRHLQPDIYTRGMDAKGKELDSNENLFYEAQELHLVGGKLIFIKNVPFISSTGIINHTKQSP